jgi:hypothetical protein
LDALTEALMALEADQPMSPEAKSALIECATTHRDLAAALVAGAADLEVKIAALRFGNDAFKAALLLDCKRLLLAASQELQERIFDRILSALKSKSPDPPPAQPGSDALSLGGVLYDKPKRFEGVPV